MFEVGAGPSGTSANATNELRAAAETWRSDAIECIKNDRWRISWNIDRDEHWEPSNEEHTWFRRREVERYYWAETSKQAFMDLPSYEACVSAAKAHPAVARFDGKLIGSTTAAGQFNVDRVLLELVPAPGPGIALDEPFEIGFARFWDEVCVTQIEEVAICFIHGAVFPLNVGEIAPGLTIERATKEEIDLEIRFNLLVSTFAGGRSVFQLAPKNSFVLRRRSIEEIGPVEPAVAGPPAADRLGFRLEQDIETFNLCAALVFDGEAIELSGRAIYTPERVSRLHTRWTQFWSFTVVGDLSEGITASEEQVNRFREVWAALGSAGFLKSRALALAVRRLSQARSRPSLEDRLIDVFVAAEAFYLADSGSNAKDRGELRYRLALRAALWSNPSANSGGQRAVYGLMRRGYDARSALVHGSEYSSKRGGSESLLQLVTSTEEVVRAALRRAVTEAAKSPDRFGVDWDELIFGPVVDGSSGDLT